MQSLFLLITLAVLLAVLLADVLNALLDPGPGRRGKAMASTELSAGLGTPVTPSTGQPGVQPGPGRGRATRPARTGMALNRLYGAVRSNRKASAGAILLGLRVRARSRPRPDRARPAAG